MPRITRAASSPELATASRTESVLVAALLTSMGTLVLVLGVTGVICQRLGIG